MKEIDIEDMTFDFTPMIDVVFLLLIFFMLMPAKKNDRVLEANLPQHSGVKPPAIKITNKLKLRAKEIGNILVTEVIFNNQQVCKFKSFSKASLKELYELGENQIIKVLAEQSKVDRLQFHAVTGNRIPRLINVIKENLKCTEKGYKTDIFIDADSKVPFKIIMAIINAGKAGRVRNLKFKRPDKSIWDSM